MSTHSGFYIILLLMVEILHDLMYQSPRNPGSIVYMG